MTTATELAALTERLSNHIDMTEKAWGEVVRERSLATEERRAILEQLQALHRDMQQVKPVTDMVSSLRSKVTGGLIVLGFLGAVAWTGILFFKDAMLKLILGD